MEQKSYTLTAPLPPNKYWKSFKYEAYAYGYSVNYSI